MASGKGNKPDKDKLKKKKDQEKKKGNPFGKK